MNPAAVRTAGAASTAAPPATPAQATSVQLLPVEQVRQYLINTLPFFENYVKIENHLAGLLLRKSSEGKNSRFGPLVDVIGSIRKI